MRIGVAGVGRFAPAAGWWRRRAAAPVWGYELAGRPLWHLWDASDWAGVEDDALVLYLARLAWSVGRGDLAGSRAEMRLRRALGLQLTRAVDALRRDGLAGNVPDALALAVRTGALSALAADEAWREARHARGAAEAADAAGAAHELAVLACLDRLLRAALPLDCAPDSAAPLAAEGLADALVASIHAQFNAAYAFARLAPAHELLATGAWLGHLRAGRPALMLDFMADCLLDYGAAAARDDGSEAAACGHILRWLGETAIGAEALADIACRVRAGGQAIVVRPGPQRGAGSERPYPWNPRLVAEIGARLR